jgi:hypothetical protein
MPKRSMPIMKEAGVTLIGANLTKLGLDKHVFSVARAGGVEWYSRRRAIFAGQAWG